MPAKSLPGATPRPARARRWSLLVLGGLILLGGAHAVLWAWSTAMLDEGVATWASLRRAEGWEVTHGATARGGWPLAADVVVRNVTLRRDGLGWQAGTVTVRLQPGSWDRLHLSASGPMALAVMGTTIPMAAEGLAAELPLGPRAVGIAGLPREAALRADRVRLDLAAGAVIASAPRLDLVSGDGTGPEDPLAVLRGSVASISLPPAVAGMPGVAVLGATLDRIILHVAVGGPWPGLSGTPAARAMRWRDGGGTLALRELGTGWGAARVGANGLFALDAALQPAGEGSISIAGGGAVLDAARAAGLIGRREAAGAQLLLAMMQTTPPDGGPPRVELPAVLERRTLSLAGMALGQLPAWRWPGASP